jgi:hypothetical protein
MIRFLDFFKIIFAFPLFVLLGCDQNTRPGEVVYLPLDSNQKEYRLFYESSTEEIFHDKQGRMVLDFTKKNDLHTKEKYQPGFATNDEYYWVRPNGKIFRKIDIFQEIKASGAATILTPSSPTPISYGRYVVLKRPVP